MIRPLRIEVTNIRSVEHAVLTPADGITALTGAIGAGKSTMLDALAYALYGDGVGLTQADMRRKGAADTDTCEVTATVLVGTETYVVTRGVRRKNTRGGAREDAYARLSINGTDVAGMTPTRLTAAIVEATGLTGRAYLGAFYIPQGQLAALTEATPSQVQEVFEAQTGLSTLTKRIAQSQTDARSARAVAEALPGTEDDVVAAQMTVDAAQAAAQKSWAVHEAADAAARHAQARLAEASSALSTLRAQAQAATQAQVEAARLAGRAEQEEQAAADARAQAAEVDEAAVRTSERVSRMLSDALTAHRLAADAHERATQRSGDLAARARAACAAASRTDVAAIEARLAEHTGALRVAEETRAVARADYDRTSRVIAVLDVTDSRGAACPTCSQPVGDLHSLLSEQRHALADLVTRGKRAAADVEEYQRAIAQAQNILDTARRAARDAEQAQAQAVAAADERAVAEQALAAARSALHTALTESGASVNVQDDVIAAAQAALDRQAQVLTAAAVARQAAVRATRHEDAAAQARAAALAAQERAAQAPTDDALATAVTTEADARRDEHDTSTTAAAARTQAMLDAQAVQAGEKARDEAERTWATKREAARAAEVATNAAALLAALRRDLLAEYTETVSAAATEIIQSLGGEHTGFVIGEDFIPRVILDDGTTRATRLLSGGEKARAALCFRLGITHQITGGTPTGMLLADEITAAHDETTRQAVVQMLADLGIPLLIVAHTDDVAQIAAQVVHATKTANGTHLTVLGQTEVASEPEPVGAAA